jgi:selenocysteine lyase/cysteine desulfurase
MSRELPNQRHLFDIPDSVAYLNCAYFSPQLTKVQESGWRGVATKNQPWKITAQNFFADTEKARQLFAGIISASPDDIALIPSVSYGVNLAASILNVPADQEILILAEQFPSNVYPWRELAARHGSRIRTVPRPADSDWTSAVLSAITSQTAVAALPIVHWTDGSCLDMEQIAVLCREKSIKLVIDGTQSIGAMPVSIAKIRPDFLITATYKWLMGPYSFGFMYVNPDHHSASPMEHNWINRRDSENFSGLVNYPDDYQNGARRFDVGEKSNFVLTPMVITALQQILDWQVENIQHSIKKHTDRLASELSRLAVEVVPQHRRCAHILGVRFPEGLPTDISARLTESDVYVSIRGNAIRIAPHLYNTEADLMKLVEVLEKTS